MTYRNRQFAKLAVATALVVATLPLTAAAQTATATLPVAVETSAKKGPASTQNVVSINPIGVVFEVFSGEYERAVGTNLSVAVAGTLWRSSQDYDDVSYSADARVSYFSTDAKLRYYPTTALRGFSVGGLLGATRLGGEVTACDTSAECEGADGSEIALSTGVEIDYSWRLGSSQKFFIATGFGAKRLFPLAKDVDATLAYPFARLSIGFGF